MKKKIVPGDGDPRHGTENGYKNLSCRCTACRVAMADACYMRSHQPRELPVGDPRHGTSSAFRWWRCRCRICLDGEATRKREKRGAR